MDAHAPAPEHQEPGKDAAHPSLVFLSVVTVLAAAADLGSKYWAKARLSGIDPGTGKLRHLEVIKDHFDFIYTLNPGGAWSFLRNLPENLRRPFFLFVSAGAIVFIVSVYRRIHRDQTAMKWGLPLALGGAIGNLVDRIRYGSVIDFVDWYVLRNGREVHWPTFNVADIAIVIGVALMGIDTLIASRRDRSRRKAEEVAAVSDDGASARSEADVAPEPVPPA